MEITKNIYRQAASIYDIVYENNPPMPDVPFYREYAKQYCGEDSIKGEILELGCGTGRVALVLAKEGFNVTGLDLSQQMLDIFHNKLNKEILGKPELSQRMNIIHGNMANFSIDRKFALITAPFRAFQSVTSQQDIEGTLSCVQKHLTEEGVFIVNVFKPYAEPLDESWCRPETYLDEIIDKESGIKVERYECREQIDPVNQIIYANLAYNVTYPDGRTERLDEPLQLKYYYSHQLYAEVEKADMEIIEEYSWYDKSPPDGREIILVCKRKD